MNEMCWLFLLQSRVNGVGVGDIEGHAFQTFGCVTDEVTKPVIGRTRVKDDHLAPLGEQLVGDPCANASEPTRHEKSIGHVRRMPNLVRVGSIGSDVRAGFRLLGERAQELDGTGRVGAFVARRGGARRMGLASPSATAAEFHTPV